MTTLYSENFDSFSNGAAVPGWIGNFVPWDLSGVGGNVSGTNAYSTIGHGDEAWCKYTGISARQQVDVVYKQKAVFNGAALGLLHPSWGDDETKLWGTFNYQMLLSGTASGVAVSFQPYLAGSFPGELANGSRSIAIAAGDTIAVRLKVDNKVVSLWVWNESSESMPASPLVTWTDGTQRAAGYFTVFGSDVSNAIPLGIDDLVISDITASGATGIMLTSPASGYVGIASTNFTVSANGAISGSVSVTPSESASGGTFSPAFVTINSSSPTATFTYTPGSSGAKSISVTNDGGLANPAAVTYTAIGITNIEVDNAALFWSPYSWDLLNPGDLSASAKSKQTNLSGSYLKFRFTGSTSLKIGIDASMYSEIAANDLPILMWSIDNGAAQTHQLSGGTTEVSLVAGLATGVTHTCQMWVFGLTNNAGNRWGSAGVSPTNVVRITGCRLDEGGSVSAPTLQAKRAIIFGDSITEGHRSLRNGSINAAGMGRSLGWFIGEALGSEFSVVGFSGQDFGTTDPLPLSSTWSNYSAGRARSFSAPPDYVFSVMGTNNANTAAQVSTWIAAVRTALGAAAHIFVCVATSGIGAASMTSGVSDYLAANPSDLRVHLIDVRTEIPVVGMSTFGPATYFAEDGIHIDEKAQATWAAAVVAKISRIVEAERPATTKTVSLTLTDAAGTPSANLSGLKWAWWDVSTPDLMSVADDSGASESTDASGVLTIAVRSNLSAGQTGWLVVTDSNGNAAITHKAFSGPVTVT